MSWEIANLILLGILLGLLLATLWTLRDCRKLADEQAFADAVEILNRAIEKLEADTPSPGVYETTVYADGSGRRTRQVGEAP